MTMFTNHIEFNCKTYLAEVSGYYQPFEHGTLETPEVKESFQIESILIYPANTMKVVELMDLSWSFTDTFLRDIEKDFFDWKKGEDYED